jgi:predicted nuclease of predicted toxin-antitoxin system
MAIGIYMDVHMPKAITVGLRIRGVDVVTAQEDGTSTLPDEELLDRATELGRVLVTFDSDLLVEADKRQREEKEFVGVIYARLLRVNRSIEQLTAHK